MGIVTGSNNSFKSRLWSNFSAQLGAILFGDIIFISLSYIVSDTWGLVALIIINWFILLAILYSSMWEQGNVDYNKSKFNENIISVKKAFIIGAIATSPAIISSLLLILGKLGLFYNIVFIYKLLNPHIWPIMNLINNNLYFSNISMWELIIYTLISTLPILFSGLFYILGSKNIEIVKKIVYKKEKQ